MRHMNNETGITRMKIDSTPLLSRRPEYEETKTAVVEMQKKLSQDNIVHFPTKEKAPSNDKFDPECVGSWNG